MLGDSAYGTGHLCQQLRAGGHTLLITAPPLLQAVPGGCTIDDFLIDTAAGAAT
ncbi:hypothetical protein ACWD04_25590 [Streptomyces sp. NPDC002911]